MLGLFEKNRDAPKSAKAYQGENNTCNHMGGSGENPGNKIKVEESYASPVKTANDQKSECNSV